MNLIEQTASELGVEVVPNIEPVTISGETCPKHSFRYISMPRDERGDDLNYSMKCPLRSCSCGVMKPRNDE